MVQFPQLHLTTADPLRSTGLTPGPNSTHAASQGEGSTILPHTAERNTEAQSGKLPV